jgi:hypothetical protein
VVVVVVVLAAGFVAGRASGEDGDSPGRRSGEGVPAGPNEIDQGMPVGFAHNTDGALGAAVAWIPWFFSRPPGERPAGLEQVLATGVKVPGGELDNNVFTGRLEFTPIGVRVEMTSDNEAKVTMVGPLLYGDVGQQLSGQYLALPVTLGWDASLGDWRITSLPTGPTDDYQLATPLQARDLAGYRAIRPAGAIEGPFIVEKVPGE